MIIFDTNIISEFMRGRPNDKVVAWLNVQDPATLFITSVSIAEIHFGLGLLPSGKRRNGLELAFNKFCTLAFAERVLTFDSVAAVEYGQLRSDRQKIGRPMSTLDGQIAAIAKTQNGQLATRNIADFNDCSLDLINPFEE